MDRSIAYTSEQGRSTDFLFAQRAAMIGLAKLSETVLGSGVIVDGLQTTQTTVASMNVQVAIGKIYSPQPVDATAYGVLAADTADTIIKQGLLMTPAILSTPAPTTSGYSINYLVQATYQDQDTNNVVLPYFNSANPLIPLTGQSNSGVAQPTQRQGICVVSAKAGAAATTGSQTTPAPDAGYMGLYVVTVAYGASTVVNANISPYSGASSLPGAILQTLQMNLANYAIGTGTANAHAASFSPAITALTDGMVLWFKAAAANTGATTLNVNGLGASPVIGAAHSALQGGEIIANGKCQVVWNATLNSWVLIECTGGALQVAPAVNTQQALQFGQSPGIAGQASNVKMYVSTASASGTLTADEIIVEGALGGLPYKLASFSKTINLATTGAGGMDTGAAPVNGYVGIYAIYNPGTATSALLATNATSTVLPTIYGGANMPAGYTASALLTVVPTNGSSQMKICRVINRKIYFQLALVYSGSSIVTGTAISVSGALPPNALETFGELLISSSSASSMGLSLSSDSSGIANQNLSSSTTASISYIGNFANVPVITSQTLYVTTQSTAGTPTFSIYIGGYSI